MRISKAFLLLFLLPAFVSGCSLFDRSYEKKDAVQINENANTISEMDKGGAKQTPYLVRASAMSKQYDFENTQGVTGILHNYGFYYPLIQFYLKNNRYPFDLKEFLNSKLCLIWPSEFESGDPLKPVNDRLKPREEDCGKICYVRESDQSAFFEIVFETPKGYVVARFPEQQKAERLVNAFHEQEISSEKAYEYGYFQLMRSICQGTFFRAEYLKFGNTPQSIDEALIGNYYWIRENMAPQYISADPEIPYFAEWGTAKIDGKNVYFLEITEYLYGKKYRKFGMENKASNEKVIYPLPSAGKLIDEDENWDKMTDKVYFYSTRMISNDTLQLPNDVLIGIDEILNPD